MNPSHQWNTTFSQRYWGKIYAWYKVRTEKRMKHTSNMKPAAQRYNCIEQPCIAIILSISFCHLLGLFGHTTSGLCACSIASLLIFETLCFQCALNEYGRMESESISNWASLFYFRFVPLEWWKVLFYMFCQPYLNGVWAAFIRTLFDKIHQAIS